MVKKYAPRQENLKEKIYLLTYPKPMIGKEIARHVYGDPSKFPQIYREKENLIKEGYIKKPRRGEGYEANSIWLLSQIEKTLQEKGHPLDTKERKQLLDFLNSNSFRGLINLEEAQEYTSPLDYFYFEIGVQGLQAFILQSTEERYPPLTEESKKRGEELMEMYREHHLFIARLDISLNEKLIYLLPTNVRKFCSLEFQGFFPR